MVTRYRIEASTPGRAIAARNIPVLSSSTPLRRTLTNLGHASRYTVRIYAITKFGWSDPYVVSVAVA